MILSLQILLIILSKAVNFDIFYISASIFLFMVIFFIGRRRHEKRIEGNTSRPTLNVLLNELKAERYLHFDRKEIILKNI